MIKGQFQPRILLTTGTMYGKIAVSCLLHIGVAVIGLGSLKILQSRLLVGFQTV